ncbi:DUF397 domain-containing protein [Nocardia sp. NPDC005746]|uniref:DUF397 domain-containing protein n=1 Tax=Nocardia sp. NPDC005746 TaxID=3157062 RepID=UPI0033FEBBC7
MNVKLSDARWFKSSYSQAGGECVEVAFIEGERVAVRDSKDRTGPAFIFAPDAWDAFAAGVRNGEFDCP